MTPIKEYMDGSMQEKASRYHEAQEKLESKKEELKELQAGTFGTDSEDTEERARQFFSNASRNGVSGQTEKIDKLRDEVSELQDELGALKDELLERLVDLQLPFEQVIEPGEEAVKFPFYEQIPEEVLRAIEDVLNEDLNSGDVSITTDELVVNTDDVEQAIERAETRIEGLRANAGTKVDIDEYLGELRNRDRKVALMLYILHQEEPLTKKGIESRMGVEPGTLRGQLYYVLDNDPYLKKQGEEVSLTETGREVIKAFVEKYGEPERVEQPQEVSE